MKYCVQTYQMCFQHKIDVFMKFYAHFLWQSSLSFWRLLLYLWFSILFLQNCFAICIETFYSHLFFRRHCVQEKVLSNFGVSLSIALNTWKIVLKKMANWKLHFYFSQYSMWSVRVRKQLVVLVDTAMKKLFKLDVHENSF